jgi:hypothetical protein
VAGHLFSDFVEHVCGERGSWATATGLVQVPRPRTLTNANGPAFVSAVSHQVPVPLVIATPGIGYRNVGMSDKKNIFDKVRWHHFGTLDGTKLIANAQIPESAAL